MQIVLCIVYSFKKYKLYYYLNISFYQQSKSSPLNATSGRVQVQVHQGIQSNLWVWSGSSTGCHLSGHLGVICGIYLHDRMRKCLHFVNVLSKSEVFFLFLFKHYFEFEFKFDHHQFKILKTHQNNEVGRLKFLSQHRKQAIIINNQTRGIVQMFSLVPLSCRTQEGRNGHRGFTSCH